MEVDVSLSDLWRHQLLRPRRAVGLSGEGPPCSRSRAAFAIQLHGPGSTARRTSKTPHAAVDRPTTNVPCSARRRGPPPSANSNASRMVPGDAQLLDHVFDHRRPCASLADHLPALEATWSVSFSWMRPCTSGVRTAHRDRCDRGLGQVAGRHAHL